MPLEITFVGARRRVRAAQGLTVPIASAHSVPSLDAVLVLALGAKMADKLTVRLTNSDVVAAVAA